MSCQNTFAFYWRFIGCLTITKVYHSALIRVYSLLHWHKTSLWPESITVEPAAMCNLNCPECTIGNGSLLRPQGMMEKETFEKAILPVSKYLVHCQFYFQGEPFINPQLHQLVEIAHQQRIFTSTSTNGHFLTAENCRKIIQAGLDKIIISVDGTTQETYSHYRQGGNLNKVIDGIKNLAKARKELKKLNPLIVVQFIVFKHNEHQICAIKQLAKKWGADAVVLKSAQIDHMEQAEMLLPSNPKYSRYSKNKESLFEIRKSFPVNCFRLRSIAVIDHQGTVIPCCYDKNGRYAFGSLDQNSLPAIWNSPTANTFRLRVWNEKESLEICQNCPEGMK